MNQVSVKGSGTEGFAVARRRKGRTNKTKKPTKNKTKWIEKNLISILSSSITNKAIH